MVSWVGVVLTVCSYKFCALRCQTMRKPNNNIQCTYGMDETRSDCQTRHLCGCDSRHKEPSNEKAVFKVSDQGRLKPFCAAIETSLKLKITDLKTRPITLSTQPTKKGVDQTVRIHRLIKDLGVCKEIKKVFS